MDLDARVEQTQRVGYLGIDTSIGAKVLCYTDGPCLRKLAGFGNGIRMADPIVVRIIENFYAFINRNPYDVIVLEASEEAVVLDLVDALDRTICKTYGPYEKRGKPVVSVVSASEKLISLLNSTYRNSGIRFVMGNRREDVVDAGLKVNQKV